MSPLASSSARTVTYGKIESGHPRLSALFLYISSNYFLMHETCVDLVKVKSEHLTPHKIN